MKILRSFLLRLSEIFSMTAGLCFLIMAITLGIQLNNEGMYFFSTLTAICLLWVAIVHFVIRKVDPELIVETARFLYPGAAAVALVTALSNMVWLDNLIPGDGVQHYTVGFVGLGVMIFMIVRIFDIKWLRNYEELYDVDNG
jgi:hypothetical protein